MAAVSGLTLCMFCPSTGGHEGNVASWQRTSREHWPCVIDQTVSGEGAGYLAKVEKFRTGLGKRADIHAILHSDLTIHEPGWDKRVLAEFEDSRVGIVSFCGATRHGTDDIYRTPYDYKQLARGGFISNLSDAEAHGTRNTGTADVAVVDSFSLIVRRSFLDRCGGWPVHTYPSSHVSDYWACLMCHRLGYRIRFVGVACSHTSGGVRGDGTFDYPAWARTTRWGSDEEMHRVGHRLIAEEFKDILPVVIREDIR